MPNWKSYESSVRLLSAIIAAHPTLKLNYDDVARYYGDGAKYKSVWDRMNIINKNAKAISAAVDAGQDPFAVPFDDTQTAAKSSKAQDISAKFGGDCTKSAIENRFRRLKSDAKLINDAVKNGVDPISINVGDTDGKIAIAGGGGGGRGNAISRCFGSDVTSSAVHHAIQRQVRPAVKLINDARAAGGDPKDLDLPGKWTEIARCFGTDATPKAVNHVFSRRVRPAVKMINDALKSGGDPKDLAQEIVACYGSTTTKTGLQTHIARDITPNVKLIQDIRRQGGDAKDVVLIEGVRAGNPRKEIVRFYGSHCTKSALQNHFNRDLNPNVKILKGMVKQGLDPKDAVLIEGVRPGNPGKSQTFIDALSEVARCYGQSVNGKAIRNFFDRTVKHDVKAVLDTLKAGGDPEDLQLSGIVKLGGGTKETAKCFGDGLKGHALSMHFQRNIKPASKLILEAIARGEDPAKTVPVGAEAKGSGAKEMVKYFGSDATSGSLKIAAFRHVNPHVKLVKDHANAGGDCKNLYLAGDFQTEIGKGGKDIVKHFDTSSNRDAIRMAIARHVTPNVKLVLDCVAAGGNPMDLNIGNNEVKDAGKGTTKELAKHFGSDTTPGGISKIFSRHIAPQAKLVRDCVQTGGDPKDLNLVGDVKIDASKGGKKDIAEWFGSDATAGGIRFQFSARIKKDIDALREGRGNGVDCKDIALPSLAEMAAIMGSDVTPNGLKFQFTDRIKPMGKKQQEMRSAGLDPKGIDLDSLYSAKSGGKTGRNISKYFGKDSTKGGIEFQFRSIKADAKRQKACYDAGRDPQTLGIGSGIVKSGGSAITHYMAEGTTGVAVEHRFRMIKKEAATLKSIALRLQDGTTAAALQHRFRDIKKDVVAMNAAIAGSYGEGVTENGGAKKAPKTPSKRNNTPKKKAAAFKGENGDDDEAMPDTPSKSALNKVKVGRVTKTATPRRNAATKAINYEESEDEEALHGTANVEMVSDDEDISSSHYANGNGAGHNGHNGFGNGFANNGHFGGNGFSNTYDNDGYDDDDLAAQDVYVDAVDEEV
ncbi:hypothetical protein IFR05_005410 [Cadophora sp. M221]|nr:hypothetical protein IFR05_005410 [Cadophora sp. M221]